MRFKRLFIIFWILFSATGSGIFAQEPFFRQIPLTGTSIGFKINSICQDASGFVWLATNDGLWKNEGVAFVRVKLPATISDNNITAIHPLWDEGIIAGTSKGKLFTMHAAISTILAEGSMQEATSISSICQTAPDEFWFATFGQGLFRVNSNTTVRYTMENGLGDNYIYSILADSAGRIWIGSDGGLSYSEFKKNNYSFRNLTTIDGLPENIVRLLIKGPGNTIGIGMEELGFCLYNIDNASFALPDSFQTWSNGPVTALMKLQNEFWIGTQKSGIIDYEFQADRRMRQFSKDEGFPGLNVNAIFKDRSGNIWIGAGSELYLSPGEIIEFKRQVGKVNLGIIHAILVDRYDNIWFSNDSGFFCYKKDLRRGFILTKPLNGTAYDGLNIISLYEDKFGYLWMGTFDKGVLRYYAETSEGMLFNEKNGLVNSSVLSIAGQDSEVWFATLGGVSKCMLEDSLNNGNLSFVSYGKQNGLGNNFIYKVYIDSRKRVWFGTDGKGITCYADGQFTNYSEAQGLNSKIIYSITEDHKGAIWLSSSGDGIYRFDGKSFRNISIKQGLSDLNITSLVTDRNGNIIIIHKKGIDALNPDNFQLISYGNEIGISDIDPDVNVVDIDRKGIVWIGTSSGIIKLNLEERAGDKKPELILKNVFCYLERIDTTVSKVFAYNRNHISFDYTTLWFSDPQKVIYQYKLDGYNKEWITTGDRFVTFPNLRPGNYTFMIRTSVNNNFSNSEVESISFVIQSPIWQRLWFISLITILAVLILYFYVRHRDKKLKSDERLKKEKIESQYEILKNQVNPHFLFNSFNTLITVIEDDRDVAIEYVNKLSDFFRSILTYSEKDLIPVSEELDLVEIYIFLQQKRYGANFTVKIDIPAAIRDTCLIPPLTLQILIENCLKHNAVSRETKLFVDIYVEESTYLVVKNNINPRIKKEPSTGIGLNNLKNRYQLINDTEIVILDSGSHFFVKLPLIKI